VDGIGKKPNPAEASAQPNISRRKKVSTAPQMAANVANIKFVLQGFIRIFYYYTLEYIS
jgi:hypothetical protein